jgi:hypothetical protein
MTRPPIRALLVLTVLASCVPSATGQVNDECFGATWIAPNTYTSGNTTAATTGFPSACNSGKDVWYKFTAPYSGLAEFSTCAFLLGSATFDTVITAWYWNTGWECTANGSNGGSFACNDDYCFSQSYLSFHVSYGATYYVSVGGWGGASGSFVLAFLASPDVPPNDLCANAIPMTLNFLESGETFGAGAGGSDPVGSCGLMGKDVWYTFTAPWCGTYTLSTCGMADFDTVIAVWQGTCGALTQIACNDDNCTVPGSGLNSTVSFAGVGGTTYYVSLGGFAGAAGDYAMSIAGTGAAPISLAFVHNGPGTVGYAVSNGPAFGLAFTAITLLPGAYPTGWFYGIDIAIPDLIAQWSTGFPFVTALGAACTTTTVGPFPFVPTGLTLYAVTAAVPSPGSPVAVVSAPASTVVP